MKGLLRDIVFWFRFQRKRLKIYSRYIGRFLAHDLWDIDESIHTLSRWKTRFVLDLKVIMVLILSYSKRRISFQATALAFRTILAMVPLLAVILYILSNLGFEGYLEGFIMDHVNQPFIGDMLLSAARNLVSTSTTDLFGLISGISFLWILVWMMLQVITVFDNVWGNIRKRSFTKNLLLVITMIVLMPFVLLLFNAGFLSLGHVLDFVIPGEPGIKQFISWTSLGVVTVLIFALMYTYIPSVKVRFRYALRAAIVSGVIFTLIEYLYFGTQIFLTGQSAVYGYFAAVPLFMVWLNLGWTVILFGAELTYAVQAIRRKDITVRELDEFRARSRAGQADRYGKVSDIIHDVKSKRN